jgi:nucleotide-binding universal stress UspA family protein
MPTYVEAHISPEILEIQKNRLLDEANEVKALFEERLGNAGIAGEWRLGEGPAHEVVATSGRYADLVVVGQDNPDEWAFGNVPDLAVELVFAVGRPVLVVPYIGAPATLGERIMVAWDGSREATRAVNDALPLLERAKHVTVLAINPTGRRDGDIPSADICLHLARHGVEAEAAHVESGEIGVGDMLLSRAADDGADMIVMGAYGHSRLREMALGGVTRNLLAHMTVPVLMSH